MANLNSQTTYLEDLTNLLQTDDRLVNEEGKLLKTKITELAQNNDPGLLSLLLSNQKIKDFFFIEVSGVIVFNPDKFLSFVHNEAFLADSYTAFKNKIGLATSRDNYINESNKVVLNWPYKDCVLEGGQDKEDQKRDEIFWNETLGADQRDTLLAPKVLTGFKRHDKDGEHDVTELTNSDNLIIRGNNLLALYSLEKRYTGLVKLIYIDLPFNTGNDSFGYNDRFNHSTWLTFVRNRAEIGLKLLNENGFFAVHCDDNEAAYVKVLLDEVIGRDKFMATIAIKSSTPSGTKTAHKDKKIIKQKDLVHIYRKNNSSKINPQYVARTTWDDHYSLFVKKVGSKYVFTKVLDELNNIGFSYKKLSDINPQSEDIRQFILKYKNNITRLQSHKNKELDKLSRTKYKDQVYEHKIDNQIAGLYYNGQVLTQIAQGIKTITVGKITTEYWSTLLCDFWADIDFQNTQNEGGVDLPNGKKPEMLLKRILELFTNKGDIVLDYHLGSGTTAAVSHKLNRQYIGIEQMDYGPNDSIHRLVNVINNDPTGISDAIGWKGGGCFVYAQLKNDVNVFIEQVEKAKDKKELELLLTKVLSSNFLSYRVNPKKFEKAEFDKFSLAEQKRLLIELVDKNKLYVNYHDIDDATYGIDANTKKLNHWLQDKG